MGIQHTEVSGVGERESRKTRSISRLVIAGLSGDAGKSLVTLGLIKAFSLQGVRVAPFKKGPDFIDSAWHGVAAARAGRNLDTFLMPKDRLLRSFLRGTQDADLALLEGNRGLFDGLDARGSHSTSRLAKDLKAPIVLVVNAAKVTRTVAALVLGCQKLEPDLPLAGVILNQVGTARQEAVIREAVELETGLPVLGAIPKLKVQHLPDRHLGLLTAVEHPDPEGSLEQLALALRKSVDMDALLKLAASADELPDDPRPLYPSWRSTRNVTLGVLRDAAFSFYYPENLEALEAAGATLVYLSPLKDAFLPSLDGLYIGGGFPEVYASQLAANTSFKTSLKTRIVQGLPVWAECGGLMYLSRGIRTSGEDHPMADVLPFAVEQTSRPQGHGYLEGMIDQENPFLPVGFPVCGHEFHYSRTLDLPGHCHTALRLTRGTGLGGARDGVVVHRVMAEYAHLHALGTPLWAPAVVAASAGEPFPRDAGA